MREAGVRVRARVQVTVTVTVTAAMVGGWVVTGLHQPPPPTRNHSAHWNHMGRVTAMGRNGLSSVLSPLTLAPLSSTHLPICKSFLDYSIANILMLDDEEGCNSCCPAAPAQRLQELPDFQVVRLAYLIHTTWIGNLTV
ncbi:hypothetical protein F4803DRAFT_552791 [Xylaria telfairii]|nr:hypothetical protein F4803DRAFT_552791 [Xylaria telfairii]